MGKDKVDDKRDDERNSSIDEEPERLNVEVETDESKKVIYKINL